MGEPYLIAHKVRDQPAFDIAERMQCPHCYGPDHTSDRCDCHECDGLGYWWIIPTSGHRAYPYWDWPLAHMACDTRKSHSAITPEWLEFFVPPMPLSLPDHYLLDATVRSRQSLAEALGLNKPKPPSAPIVRRI